MKKNTAKAIRLLKKIYHPSNADYEKDYKGSVGYKTNFLTIQDKELLEQENLVPNAFEEHTHDAMVNGFLELKNNQKLTLDFATSLFIKGLSGNSPRFRQTLISYWYMQKMEEHVFTGSKSTTNCSICGLPKNTVEDRTHSLFTYYLGHSWNEMPRHFLFELQEILTFSKPDILEEDTVRFHNLLKEIDKAEANETPGQLEKRIATSKLLPKTDKYKRYGILQTLAVVGVLPSGPSFNKQSVRSDIVMPLAGWRGQLGVDYDKVKEVFKLNF